MTSFKTYNYYLYYYTNETSSSKWPFQGQQTIYDIVVCNGDRMQMIES